MHIITKAMSNI